MCSVVNEGPDKGCGLHFTFMVIPQSLVFSTLTYFWLWSHFVEIFPSTVMWNFSSAFPPILFQFRITASTLAEFAVNWQRSHLSHSENPDRYRQFECSTQRRPPSSLLELKSIQYCSMCLSVTCESRHWSEKHTSTPKLKWDQTAWPQRKVATRPHKSFLKLVPSIISRTWNLSVYCIT